jgi:hypothetical protein
MRAAGAYVQDLRRDDGRTSEKELKMALVGI